jgi:hypothetical protein
MGSLDAGADRGSSMRGSDSGGSRMGDRGDPYTRNDRGNDSDTRGPTRMGGSDRFGDRSGGAGDSAAAGGGWGNRSSGGRPEQGPPPVTNSRFAKAAAMSREENGDRDDRRPPRENDGFGGDRGGGGGRSYNSGGVGAPMQQNSRFASAASNDPDYVDRPERERRMQDRDREGGGGGRGGGGFRNDWFGGQGSGGRDEPLPKGPRGSGDTEVYSQPGADRVEALLKPKSKNEELVLKPPTKMHEENMFKIPAKALSKGEDEAILPTKKKVEREAVKEEPPKTDASAANVEELMGKSEDLLKEFVAGNKQGDELASWMQANKVGLPPVEKLVFELLMEREKLNPNPDCPWAERANYGAGLLSLTEDDVVAQMQILWGIQLYCDKVGFPKLNDESICQAMFRSMYKFDLVLDQAFAEWKEDESDEHMAGKTNAIVQTMDWFTWLEQDDEEEEEEY